MDLSQQIADKQIEFAKLVKDILLACGFYVAPTRLKDKTSRCLSVALEMGSELPVSAVIKYVIDHAEDTNPEDVLTTLYMVSEAFSNYGFTAQKNAMFWRNIPWVD